MGGVQRETGGGGSTKRDGGWGEYKHTHEHKKNEKYSNSKMNLNVLGHHVIMTKCSKANTQYQYVHICIDMCMHDKTRPCCMPGN